MRIALYIAMAVFISTLFWPHLLGEQTLLFCILCVVILLFVPSTRILVVIPVSAIYFNLYAQLTLTGTLPFALPVANSVSLQKMVDEKDHSITVQISSLISDKNKGYFNAKLIELDELHLNYQPLIEMRWYQPTQSLQDGQLHRFKVRFKPVYGRANPAGVDAQKWRFSEHVAYQANVKSYLGERSNKQSLRAGFYEKVKQSTANLKYQGIILALSFADKSLIALQQKEQLRKLGISHLFAISGLHIGLLFSFCYVILHFVCRHVLSESLLGWKACRLVNFCALCSAYFYAYLAGFSLPTQRAFLMLFVAVLLLSIKRKYALVDLLGFVLFSILLWDPLSVLSFSLWMSFLAIAIIIFMLWRFQEYLKVAPLKEGKSYWGSIKKYLRFLVILQLALTILMMPLQLVSFSALNVFSPWVNIVAVPLFSFIIIPLVLLGCLMVLVQAPLSVYLFQLVNFITECFFSVFSAFEHHYIQFTSNEIELIIIAICSLAMMGIIHFHITNNRRVSYLFFSLLSGFVAFSVYEQAQVNKDKWFVEVFDVGQGLSILIRSDQQSMLYDTGPSYPSGFSTAKSEVIPYLHQIGITQLDYLVISHSDNDHAGGFAVMANTFTPQQVMLGERLTANDNNGRAVLLCEAGQQWSLGKLTVDVLSPMSLTKNNNNNSCVLRISDGKHSLLLTGDIEKRQELLLINTYGEKLHSDLLLAPHHGSKHSSSEPFISQVSPQQVIFASGYLNRWGFPHEKVKLRYKNQSVKMVDTGLSGFVRFTMDKEKINMQTYREDLASYWYHHSLSL